MAQDSTGKTAAAPVKERPNIVGSKPLNYKKWDDLEYESDEDDCHPNIEIGTWRRMKERMRREKGIKKKEPYLVDKWNTTTTNKSYHIDPSKPPKTTEEQKAAETTAEPDSAKSAESKTESMDTVQENTTENESAKSKDSESSSKPLSKAVKSAESEPSSVSKASASSDSSSSSKTKSASKAKAKAKATEVDDEPYKARTNPQVFLDENLDKLRKFANIKKDTKADKFIKKNPDLVHEASEGFLITFAVDRAVEGAQKPELARLARRTLMIHNLVQSCSQQNCSPHIGVEMFYLKIGSDPKMTESYKVELNKQVAELMERIEIRRKERLAELQDIPDEYDEEEKAPLGPGGLDPTEVLNSLPEAMQQAFISQEVEQLKECLAAMDADEAEYHMKRCVDAGLWVQPEDEAEPTDAPQPDDSQTEDAAKAPAIDTVD